MNQMKRICMLLLVAALAQGAGRTVLISWTPSTSQGVTGYNVARGNSITGPFTQLAANVQGNSYSDVSVPIGSTVTYQITAITQPCTPTTPVTQVCGTSSAPATATTTVPLAPTVSITVTLTVP